MFSLNKLLSRSSKKFSPLLNQVARILRLLTKGMVRIESEETRRWVKKANNSEKVAIVTCGFEFDELVNQRPINYAKYLSDKGYVVLFIAWQWNPRQVLSKAFTEVYRNVHEIPLYDFLSRFKSLKKRADSSSLFCITFPAPAFVDIHGEVRSRGFHLVYDIMDEWEGFSEEGQASWFDRSAEEALVLSADLVSCVSPPLAQKFQHLRGDIEVHGNGYNPLILGLENKGIAKATVKGAPCAGYFGHLSDAWFDWDALFTSAEFDRNIRYELIGYGATKETLNKICNHPNISYIGKVPPSDLGKYARNWTVGIIPFKPGKIALATDPIKIYEYLYMGLPVISTGIQHVSSYPNTRVANSAEELLCLIRESTTPGTFQDDSLDSFLTFTTWTARFDSLTRSAMSRRTIRELYAA